MIRSKVKIGGALEHQYRWIILAYIYIYRYIDIQMGGNGKGNTLPYTVPVVNEQTLV
jgi:hypothetical protein